MTMKAESVELANALLEQHRLTCMTGNEPYRTCTMSYGDLCRNAHVEHILRPVGSFLQEVAQWCADHGYPPLNSLAVNADTRIPGQSYDLAPGCQFDNWEVDVQRCIAFRGYPERVEQPVA
jgi:hypothetical protein